MMTVGSLFAGIGGFDLGFERTGFKTIWQVEIDDYCRRVLARHFPDAERFGDIRECGAHNLKPVDVICGGFPCQDISCAGQRVGIEGEQSGLWSEMFRIVSELRPRYVVAENVADLVIRGLDRVIGELASVGYDTEWTCVTAAGFRAPHIRERLFLVGYPNGVGLSQRRSEPMGGAPLLTGQHSVGAWPESTTQPDVAGMANGIPRRVDRVTHIGKALVPQIAEWIANRILQAETHA